MNRRTILVHTLIAVLATAVPGAAQVRDQPKPPVRANEGLTAGSASLIGTVVTDSDPVHPVRRAIVTVNSSDRTIGIAAVTDDNGHFSITGLPAGRYNVDASKRGWVTVPYGSKGPGRPGTTLALSDGQRATVSITLPRAAVITGTVLDDTGPASSPVSIRVMRYVNVGGERRLVSSGSVASGPDERGQYRIYGLAPGDYYVVAAPLGGPFRANADLHLTSDVDVDQAAQAVSDGRSAPMADVRQRSVTIAPVYYPGVFSAAQAAQISLHAGEERTGVDFVVPYVASVHVDGSVTGLDGAPAKGATITLVNNDSNATSLGFDAVRTTRTDAKGRFSFAAVTPGVYVLSTRTATGWALNDVDVQGDDIQGLSVALQESFTVSGTVRFEGTANAPLLSNVRINLMPQVSGNGVVVSSGLSVAAEADGRFTVKGVSPGRYRLNAFIPGPRAAWAMRSANLAGEDALDAYVDVRQGVTDGAIVFTDQLAELNGHAAPDSTIIIFSTNQAHWYPQSRRVLTTRAAGDGSYTVRNLPPGEYFLAGVDDVEQGQWSDPAYLQGLAPSAAKITIAEGEKKTLDLHASGG
jgi:hypothetical protein